MIRRLTPVKLSEANSDAVRKQLGVQTIERSAPKSTDPQNFPVFEVPVNSRRLVYVPNHVVMTADGTEELRMDKPLIHSIKDGNRFLSYRCVSGLSLTAEDGTTILSGRCPLCDGLSEPWDLAREMIKNACDSQGLDPEDKENANVKALRSQHFGDRVLKEANRYFTFPIVVIDTVNNDCKTPAKGEDGKNKYTPMWYHISESQYEKSWLKVLESLEDEPTHPGGHFFILDYTYTPKSGEANKRDSARALTVIGKSFKSMDGLRQQFDKATEGWTPDKARETVISNQLYSEADLDEVANQALENTRNMLALYRASTAGVGTANALPDGGNAGFNLSKAPDTPAIPDTTGAEMDETDLDFEA